MMLCQGTVSEKAEIFYDIINGVFNDINSMDEDFLESFDLLLGLMITFPL